MTIKKNNLEEADKLIKQSIENNLLRISTAGSVDDGKSTLIGRLLKDAKGLYEDQLEAAKKASSKTKNEELELAYLLDGLKSEREQGITIDVAYRYFSTPERRFIIADTPGHEQYTRNMVTGASTADVALILIDARKGILEQSKRHTFIASLLGIPHVIVVINKMDLVDYKEEEFKKIKKEFIDFSAKLKINDLRFIPISALKGDNVVEKSKKMPWYNSASLLSLLETITISSYKNLIDFRFPVQYVIRPNQDYRGFAGQIASGTIKKGDEVLVLPSGRKSKVKLIDTFDGELEHAFAPQSVSLVLEDEVDVSKGSMICRVDNVPTERRKAIAYTVWFDEEKNLDLSKTYLVKHTNSFIKTKILDLKYVLNPSTLHQVRKKSLEFNEIGLVEFEFYKPIYSDSYNKNRDLGRFIIVDPESYKTVGAGIITNRSIEAPKKYNLKPISKNIVLHKSHVTKKDRENFYNQKPKTIWMTGLSGSGKSTIGYALEKELIKKGNACFVLDGDNIRHGLNRDLGFSPANRKENIRRVSEMAKLFNDAGLFVIVTFISPYKADRKQAKELIGEENFIEIYINTPLKTCEERDPKGLYKKAKSGEIEGFTGISAPYEAPEKPSITVSTETDSLEKNVKKIIKNLFN